MSPEAGTYLVGSDIGGTFTDLALLNEATGEVTIAKVVTNPADASTSVLAGVEALTEGAPGYVSRTAEFLHATTLVANAVIQRDGARTALLATKGFCDVLGLRPGCAKMGTAAVEG